MRLEMGIRMEFKSSMFTDERIEFQTCKRPSFFPLGGRPEQLFTYDCRFRKEGELSGALPDDTGQPTNIVDCFYPQRVYHHT